MRQRTLRVAILALVTVVWPAAATPAQDARRASGPPTLDLYFVDVEGGQSTLVVTPSGETLLVDTGFPGTGTFQSLPGPPDDARDAQRILAAMHDAGVTAIDYLLITHFHADHVGGVPELAQLIPIRTFIDHGEVAPDAERQVPGTMAAFNAYATVRARGRHLEPKPGDRLPLKGVDAVVVSSAGSTIATPLPGGGARNPACGTSTIAAPDAENPRSTGVRLAFGNFRFIDLGDLSGNPLFALFCPNDLLGAASVLLVPHHGGADVADPAMSGAVGPRVAILNNGPTKGGAAQTLAALRHVQGIGDVWQVHRSENRDAQNFADERIANLDATTSHWIKVSARADGSFVVTNARTGESRTYAASK